MTPHPSFFIADEMTARGWCRKELARRLAAANGDDIGTNCLAVDMYFEVGPTARGLRLGPMADDLAHVFDVSATYFRNLEEAWLAASPLTPATGKAGSAEIPDWLQPLGPGYEYIEGPPQGRSRHDA